MHAVTIPEGLTSEQIAQRLRDSDILAGEILETPKEGALLPETYKVARGYPRTKLLAKMQEDQRKLDRPDLGAPQPRLAVPHAVRTGDAGLHRREGDRQGGGAPACRGGLRQSSAQGHAAAVRPDHCLRAGGGQGDARARHSALRARQIHALQHLHRRWIAARPDRQSRHAPRSRPSPIPPIPPIFILSPTGRAAMSSRRRWTSTTAMCSAGATSSTTIRRRPLPTWTIRRPASRLPRQRRAAPRDQRGDAGAIGRLVLLTERHDDYPPGRAMAADDGATHRLGKFGPWPGLFAVDFARRSDRRRPRSFGPWRAGAADIHARQRATQELFRIRSDDDDRRRAREQTRARDRTRRRSIGKAAGRYRGPRRRQLPRLAARARRAESRAPRNLVSRLAPTNCPPSVVGARDATPDAARPSALGYASAETGASPTSRRPRRSTLPKARRSIPCATNPGI